jgi:hypothetical protein
VIVLKKVAQWVQVQAQAGLKSKQVAAQSFVRSSILLARNVTIVLEMNNKSLKTKFTLGKQK